MDSLKANGHTINYIALGALGPSDEWVVLYDNTNYYPSTNVPSDCKTELNLLSASSYPLKSVALGSSSQWVIVYKKPANSINSAAWSIGSSNTLNTGMQAALNACYNAGNNITSITLGQSNDSVVMGNQTTVYRSNPPTAMLSALGSYAKVSAVLIGPDNDWAIAGNPSSNSSSVTYSYATTLPSGMQADIVTITNNGLTITALAEGVYGDYAILYGSNGYYVGYQNADLSSLSRSVQSSTPVRTPTRKR